jgi:hypothetical protein
MTVLSGYRFQEIANLDRFAEKITLHQVTTQAFQVF